MKLQTHYRIFDASRLFPEDLPGFEGAHQDFAPFDRHDARYRWVRGESELYGATLVPMELVWFPLGSSEVGHPLCGTANSNGVAAHTTVQDARRAALLELIERDAFVRAWTSRSAPRRFSPTSTTIQSKLRRLSNDFDVTFGQLEAIVPVVYCAVTRDDGALLAFSLSASEDADEATEKAFIDAFASVLVIGHEPSVDLPGAHVQHRTRHAVPGALDAIGWFFEGELSELHRDLDSAKLRERRHDTTFVEVPTSGSSGLVVSRALNENFRPIWFGSRWKPTDDPNQDIHFFA